MKDEKDVDDDEGCDDVCCCVWFCVTMLCGGDVVCYVVCDGVRSGEGCG